tara:strand:- start:741 stop:848 length:108 start_codon:yes stop_codon:yes gene_type:complete
MKIEMSIFSKKEYWVGVVAGVVLASAIGYFMKKKK